MKSPREISWCVLLALCWGVVAQEPNRQKSGQPTWRRYSDGPLNPADFRGKAPDFRNGAAQVPLSAYTVTEIRYDVRYQTTRDKNRWTARLSGATAYAIVERDRSWNLRLQDLRLLDHEQGHFDISHSFALSLQFFFQELLRAPGRQVGTGETSAAAIRNLEEKLVVAIQPFFDNNVKAQAEYDRITAHGLQPAAQAEQRKQQLAKIAEFEDKLKVGTK